MICRCLVKASVDSLMISRRCDRCDPRQRPVAVLVRAPSHGIAVPTCTNCNSI